MAFAHKAPEEPEIRSAMSSHFITLPILNSFLYQLWAATPQLKIKLKAEEVISEDPDWIDEEELPVVQTNVSYFYPIKIDETFSYGSKEAKKARQEGKVEGLGSLFIIALLLGRFQNIHRLIRFKKEDDKFIQWDFEQPLCFLWSFNNPDCKLTIPEDALKNLFHIPSLVKHESFISEAHFTLYKIMLTPFSLIEACVSTCFPNPEVFKVVCNTLKILIIQLEKQAILLPEFRTFLFDEKIYEKNNERCLNEFEKFAKDHKIHRRRHSLFQEMEVKLSRVTTRDSLVDYILERSRNPHDKHTFEIEYKRKCLEDIFTDAIYQSAEIEDVCALVKKLETEDKYAVLRNRQGDLTTLSIKGTTHNGEPVSETFSRIMKAAKNRLFVIAAEKAKNGDRRDLQKLQQNAFLTTPRYQNIHSLWTLISSVSGTAKPEVESETMLKEALAPNVDVKVFDSIIQRCRRNSPNP